MARAYLGLFVFPLSVCVCSKKKKLCFFFVEKNWVNLLLLLFCAFACLQQVSGLEALRPSLSDASGLALR